MGREIKFRGINPNSGTFFYGYFVNNFPDTPRIVSDGLSTPIKIETLGQSTGLKDSNGIEIYEGDIVVWYVGSHYWEAVIQNLPDSRSNTLYAVETFHNCTIDEEKGIYTFLRTDSRKGVRNELEFLSRRVEIMGNIHQNPLFIKY